MLVLQSCTDPLQILPGSSSETFPASYDGACNFGNVEVGGDVDVKEDSFMATNEKEDIDIKPEEIPEEKNFPDVTSEPDEVSYVCMSVIGHILALSINVCCFYDVSICGQLK
jgi:hypothetical protein